MAYCPKCGAQNADTLNFCGSCGVPLRQQHYTVPSYTATPPETPAALKKKRKWPFILVGIFVVLFFVGLFFDDENEAPDYGNAFAPSNTQTDNAQTPFAESSSQFSDAVNALLDGGGFDAYASTNGENGPDYYGNNDSVSIDEAYAEIDSWTDDKWAEFWLVMYDCLDEEEISYLESLSKDELISIVVEIILEE
jgi:hypothetical protein